MNKKFLNSHVLKTVDSEGNIVEQDIQKTYVVTIEDSDKFFMVYYNMLKSFYNIKYVKDVFLLVRLIEMADHNTGIVTVAAKTREDLCEELQVSKSNLSPMFKRLLDLELISGEKGVYHINEAAFWKGDASIRRDVLKSKGLEFILKFKM